MATISGPKKKKKKFLTRQPTGITLSESPEKKQKSKKKIHTQWLQSQKSALRPIIKTIPDAQTKSKKHNNNQSNMYSLEPSYCTRAEYSKTVEAQEKGLKIASMKMTEGN